MKWTIRNSWPLALFFLLVPFFKPLVVFFIPGIFIFYCRKSKLNSNPIVAIINCLAISMAFWIAAFWYLKYFSIPLSDFAITIMVLALPIGVVITYRRTLILSEYEWDRHQIFAFTLLIALGCLRFVPINLTEVPAGADMSMHTYIAVLISTANGLPSSYQPLLPIDEFGTFPIGFHTLSALLTQLSGKEAYKATFFIHCASLALITPFLYVLLSKFVRSEYALLSSVCYSFLTYVPASFMSWGAGPTVLAIAFTILFIGTMHELNDRDWHQVFLASLLLSAVLLTHTIIFVQAFYLLIFSIPVYYWFSHQRSFRFVGRVVCVPIFALIISFPYLMALDVGILTPATLTWIKEWVTNTAHAWNGELFDSIWSIPLYISGWTGKRFVLISIAFGMCAWYLRTDKKEESPIFYECLLFFSAAFILILNTQYWSLPFSYLIYPERVTAMLIVPFAVLCALGLEKITLHIRSRNLRSLMLIVIFGVVLTEAIKKNFEDFVEETVEYSSVKRDDMIAFEWLSRNTSRTDVIQNNYGDAGVWIPAIIHQPIVNPHINVAYLDKLSDQSQSNFAFIGTKCVYSPCTMTLDSLDKDETYVKLFQSGLSAVYAINPVPDP